MPVSSHNYSKYGKKLAPFVQINLALGDVPSPNKVLTVISVAFASNPVLPVLFLIEAEVPRSCTMRALFISAYENCFQLCAYQLLHDIYKLLRK